MNKKNLHTGLIELAVIASIIGIDTYIRRWGGTVYTYGTHLCLVIASLYLVRHFRCIDKSFAIGYCVFLISNAVDDKYFNYEAFGWNDLTGLALSFVAGYTAHRIFKGKYSNRLFARRLNKINITAIVLSTAMILLYRNYLWFLDVFNINNKYLLSLDDIYIYYTGEYLNWFLLSILILLNTRTFAVAGGILMTGLTFFMLYQQLFLDGTKFYWLNVYYAFIILIISTVIMLYMVRPKVKAFTDALGVAIVEIFLVLGRKKAHGIAFIDKYVSAAFTETYKKKMEELNGN